VVEPRRDVIRRVLARGAQTGELRADVDTDAALAMLTGAVFARAAQGVAAPADYPERIVTELLRGLRSR
jgi:hypothetical protein